MEVREDVGGVGGHVVMNLKRTVLSVNRGRKLQEMQQCGCETEGTREGELMKGITFDCTVFRTDELMKTIHLAGVHETWVVEAPVKSEHPEGREEKLLTEESTIMFSAKEWVS